MRSSKINQLRQSTFRESHSRQRPSKLQVRPSKLQVRPSKLQLQAGSPQTCADSDEYPDQKQLLQYQLKLPSCPFHHQPVRFLCLRADCRSSGYGVCGAEGCRSMHADPDTDLIQLGTFNDLLRDSCSSLVLLTGKLRRYFKEIREGLLHRLDLSIQRALYLVDNVYVQEVARLIRQRKHAQLSSEKLGRFVKVELAEGGAARSRMEALRNSISARIGDRETALERLCAGKDYQRIMLADLVRKEEVGPEDTASRVQLGDLESGVLRQRREVELLMKMLRENRATLFTRMTNIFKASEFGFKGHAFHKAVDGKTPLLLLVQTTLGKKFGAYINCKLNDHQEWISDASGLSFIFSIDREESYRLKGQAQSRLKAAFGGAGGPQLGSGCDLYLSEGCNIFRKSGSNLGGSYRLPAHIEANSAKARSYLAGEQEFLVQEYEVLLLQ